MRKIAESRSAAKTAACRENLAKARQVKELKRLGLLDAQNSNSRT
jgi:hypothetical protein